MSKTKLIAIWILFVIITATGLALGVSQFVWKQNSPWNWWIPFLVGIVMNVIGFLADIFSIRSALRNSDHPTSTSREGGIDVNADTADIHGDAAGRDIYNVGGDFIGQQLQTPPAEKDSSGPSKSKLLFVVPYAHNRREFFGRDKELEQLRAFLMGGNTDEGHIVGLTGMGGIGKTRLAVAYAYLYRNAYPGGVFFIESDVSLTQGFARIGSHLDSTVADRSVKEQIRVSVNHLRNHPKTLIILDDLVDAAVLNTRISSELVPAALPCRLLFTTRPRDRGLFRTIEVPELPEDAALQLLLRYKTRQQVLDPNHSEHEVARAICRILGNLPFALDRASAHLRRFPTVRLADYREELLQRGALAVLDDPRVEMRPEDSPTRHRAAVRATLASQWDALQNDKARRLLRVAGQLPSPVSISTARLGLLAGLDKREERVFSQLSLALDELEAASLVDPRDGSCRCERDRVI